MSDTSSQEIMPDARRTDETSRTAFKGDRALVLGGGGSTGNAWLIGVVAGLREGGVDVTEADLIVGTSAGSTAAAQITSTGLTELFGAISTAMPRSQVGADVPSVRKARAKPVVNHVERTAAIIASAKNIVDMRRKLSAEAIKIAATLEDSVQAQWRTTVASRLPSQNWPDHMVQIVAVDARTAEPVLFDRHSGVDLADAIAASCASGFAYRIGDQQYIDGGYRSNADNADLAAGYARVLVLSPFGGESRTPESWGTHLATQITELRKNDSSVKAIFPDDNSRDAFGADRMDASRIAPSAQAGYDQGILLAKQLDRFWGVAGQTGR